jgi:Fe-S cluster biosynthesis and repair protein YggX
MDGLKTEKVDRVKVEVELDKKIIETIRAMESYTNRSTTLLMETALKRFIATHKDYLPEDYKVL